MTSIIKLLRPAQWTKNGFIFLPLFFNGQLLNVQLLLMCIAAFIVFSLMASSVYCFNDIYDAEADRLHPVKCKRPIAAKRIKVKTAYFIMAVCFIASMGVLLVFNGAKYYILTALTIFYFLMNIAYCIKLKHYAIIDVTIISIGFVMRVVAGGQATGIRLSEWIVIMTFLLALFLSFAKRRDDVILYRKTGMSARKNTTKYNPDFMNQVMTIVSTITIIAYIIYTISPDVVARFHCQYIYLTAIFVLMGIIRYLQITIVDLKSGSPTKILLHDRFIQCCIAGWIISFLIIIYARTLA